MKTKFLSVIMLALILVSSLSSCGGSITSFTKTPNKSEMQVEDGVEESIMESDGGQNGALVTDNRKIIEKIDLTVETKEFDDLMTKLENEISSLGGYIESSSVSGNGFEYSEKRTALLTVRVPSEVSGNFTKYVSENSTVTDKSTTTEDVTIKYVDTESRLSALKAEKEALEGLLSKAETVQDIISLRDRLTEVIYEIESNETILRTYDNLVAYTTIDITVFEVSKTTVVEKQSTWEKIGTNLKNNFEIVWNGLVSLFVFIVSSLPYLLVVGIIALAVVLICVGATRRKKKNSEENEK